MTERERWIVYPLLFFAIMLGAADRLQRNGMIEAWAGPPRFHDIRCRQLVVEGLNQQPLAVWNQNEFGEVQLSMLGQGGPAVMLKAGEGGGQLLLLRDADQRVLFLGHDAELELSGMTGGKLRHGHLKVAEEEANTLKIVPWSDQDEAAEVEDPQ